MKHLTAHHYIWYPNCMLPCFLSLHAKRVKILLQPVWTYSRERNIKLHVTLKMNSIVSPYADITWPTYQMDAGAL